MNNKEFIAELSRRTGLNTRECTKKMNAFVSEFTHHLEEEDQISIPNFGIFETKKRLERVLVNPTTGQKMLVPPKIVVGFKPSTVLKNKIQ